VDKLSLESMVKTMLENGKLIVEGNAVTPISMRVFYRRISFAE
jgi:hypothetical protein